MINKISWLLGSVVVLSGCLANGQHVAQQATKSEVRPYNAVADENWVLDERRSDEFNGASIDTTKWKSHPKHVQTWTWNNEKNAKLDNGNLLIQMQHDVHTRSISNACEQGAVKPNTTLYFKSAMLETHATGILGYYEARIKGVKHFPGFSPAFWMYSQFDDLQSEPGSVRYSEIDVVEMQQRQNFKAGNERITDHNLHTALTRKNGKNNPTGREWRRPGKYHEQENVHVLEKDPADHYHVYGVRVTEEEITWYVDNQVVGQAKNNYWRQLPMAVALSLGLRKPFTEFKCNGFVPLDPYLVIDGFDSNAFNQAPPVMSVDYVRVWTKQ